MLDREYASVKDLKTAIKEGRVRDLKSARRLSYKLHQVIQLAFHLTPMVAVPKWPFMLVHLQELSLWLNQRLTSLPAALGDLKLLRVLTVVGSKQLTTVPAEIGGCVRLEDLMILGCGLTSLPDEMAQLTCLQKVYLRDNRLTSLPPCLERLPALRELTVSHNRLTQLSTELGTLPCLRKLDVQTNQLMSLPANIGTYLHQLIACENPLTRLPAELGSNRQLTWLYVTGEHLPTLAVLRQNWSKTHA